MTCSSCNDHGVFRIAYHDGSQADFALCLCQAGQLMRLATNNGAPVTPQWEVWAFRQGIPLERVAPMEDLLTDEEMAARSVQPAVPMVGLDAVAAAARARSTNR